MQIIPAGTQFSAIKPDVDVRLRSELINTEYTKVYTLEDLRGYNYVANLTQSSTNAPVAVELENGLGKTVAWTRTSTGVYTATCSANWGGVVWVQMQNTFNGGTTVAYVTSITANTIVVSTFASNGGAAADAILASTPIMIRVYPVIT
jgi:hypothetical protein